MKFVRPNNRVDQITGVFNDALVRFCSLVLLVVSAQCGHVIIIEDVVFLLFGSVNVGNRLFRHVWDVLDRWRTSGNMHKGYPQDLVFLKDDIDNRHKERQHSSRGSNSPRHSYSHRVGYQAAGVGHFRGGRLLHPHQGHQNHARGSSGSQVRNVP
jgi:hypothetical protein